MRNDMNVVTILKILLYNPCVLEITFSDLTHNNVTALIVVRRFKT